MTRVIHTGDTHLGYQQYHLPARRQDFLDAFEQVIDDAIAEDVDAVVHAGDLFHDRRPDLPDLLGALQVLRKLSDADIPFLAVVGNHETKRDAQWLDLYASLGLAVRLGNEPVTVGDTAFYGLDFVPRSQRDSLDYQFDPHDATHAALVSHGAFEPFDYGDWDAKEVLSSANIDFDAMLLGDLHKPETKELVGTWVTYCGSTERASADERDDRGYNIVEFDDGVQISRRGLPTRDFEFVDIELAEGEGIERVRERIGQHDLLDAVAIVSIEGEGESIKPARVEEFVHEQGALVARVTDRRDQPEGGDIEVSFADPDEAVRERVRELGLSTAARDLDETIRASKVANANVADTVEDRVRELVDDGQMDAFDSAPVEPDETAADRLSGEADGGSDPDEAETDAESAEVDPTENDGTDDLTEAEKAEAVVEAAMAEGGSDADDPPADAEDTSEETADDATEEDDAVQPATDSQSSMGDYL
ncbi:DNA double-strand break repair protein Mre11 [Natronomonas sp. EA1]|uniref:DNA double-strand break repair protein Mre11 n=1 Tax=Natronomonas sp. EA1 TaxID=3421655 RepID=UPI003EBFA3F0